tara:strand:- start:17 stop:310 length:294 start_codon:yes stop_codon:yes gene_type:complete
MENSIIGIVVVVAIVGFVVYQSFFKKDDVVESKPAPAPTPAPAPKAPAKPKVPSVAELNKKTKAELELLARENGVELDLRRKKADLVKEARASFQVK